MNTVQAYLLSDERRERTLAKKLMDAFLKSSLAEFNELRNAMKAAVFSKMGSVSSFQMLLKLTSLLGRVQEALSQKQVPSPSDLNCRKRLRTVEKLLQSSIRHHRSELRKSQLPVVLKWRRPAFELVALIKSLFIIHAVERPEGLRDGECALTVRLCHLLGMDISESTVRNLRYTASGSIRQDAIFRQMELEFKKWLHAEPRDRNSGIRLKSTY